MRDFILEYFQVEGSILRTGWYYGIKGSCDVGAAQPPRGVFALRVFLIGSDQSIKISTSPGSMFILLEKLYGWKWIE